MVKYMNVAVVGVCLFLGMFLDFVSEDRAPKKGLYYDHVEYSENVIFQGVNDTNLEYSAELSKPGESYTLSFDVVNDSNVDMKILSIDCPEDNEYLTYQLTYSDGSEICSGDIIKVGESKGLTYVVTYQKMILQEDSSFDTSFHVQYEQAF